METAGEQRLWHMAGAPCFRFLHIDCISADISRVRGVVLVVAMLANLSWTPFAKAEPSSSLFYGNDKIRSLALSPDGSKALVNRFTRKGISFHVINVPAGREHRKYDVSLLRPYARAKWLPDSSSVIAVDRSERVFVVDIEGNSRREIIIPSDIKIPRRIEVYPTIEHPYFVVRSLRQDNGLYRCDPRPGIPTEERCTLFADGKMNLDGAYSVLYRRGGRVAARLRRIASGASVLESLQADNSWRRVLLVEPDEALLLFGVVQKNNKIWALSNRNRKRISLVEIDIRTGEESLFYQDKFFDLNHVLLIREGDHARPVLVEYNPGYKSVKYFDENFRILAQKLLSHHKSGSQIRVLSGAWEAQKFAVEITNRSVRQGIYILDTKENTIKNIFLNWWPVEVSDIVPITIKGFDGSALHAYFYPATGKPKQASMILALHGGPWLRYFRAFEEFHQSFPLNGHNLLLLNYRGSVGYSRAYQEVAYGRILEYARKDALSAVQWAYSNGHAEKGRVFVLGDSFGGYLALNSMAEDPDVFAGGVVINTVTDSKAFWSAEWKNPTQRYLWMKYFGTELKFSDEGFSLFSPVDRYNDITKPLLVFSGKRDRRVPQYHSRKMVDVMQAAGKEVQLIQYKNAGHTMASCRSQRLCESMTRSIVQFLDRTLSGTR